jgi:hypothetical protein
LLVPMLLLLLLLLLLLVLILWVWSPQQRASHLRTYPPSMFLLFDGAKVQGDFLWLRLEAGR